MAMACCHKEYAEECEILVCMDAPVPFNRTLYSRLRFGLLASYQRLRFGLLASSWLPSPLGNFLWSALHVMLLIVCGPAFWVLGLLTVFLFYSVCEFGLLVISLGFFYVLFSLGAVACDLVLLLVQSIRFCWSLVGFLVCHEPIVEWRSATGVTVEYWKVFEAVEYWKVFEAEMRDSFWAIVPIGVPCMSGSLYKETKDQKLQTWARWCEEVVHKHEAIAL